MYEPIMNLSHRTAASEASTTGTISIVTRRSQWLLPISRHIRSDWLYRRIGDDALNDCGSIGSARIVNDRPRTRTSRVNLHGAETPHDKPCLRNFWDCNAVEAVFAITLAWGVRPDAGVRQSAGQNGDCLIAHLP
jgi:hypothetical protein